MRQHMPAWLGWTRILWPDSSYRRCRQCSRFFLRRNDPPGRPRHHHHQHAEGAE
jgi:hypothetical protein